MAEREVSTDPALPRSAPPLRPPSAPREDARDLGRIHPVPAPEHAPELSAALLAEQRAHDAQVAKANAATAAELRLDGKTTTVKPSPGGTPEFSSNTQVFYVNGIGTNWTQANADAKLYADRTHGDVTLIHASTRGLVADLATCATEKLDPVVASQQAPEQAVVKALSDDVTGPPGHERLAHDIHFAAHSRGALIVQRGIEEFQQKLRDGGMSEDRIANMLGGHLSMETFGGASSTVPPYVKAVHYVRDGDDVAEDFGQGKPTPRSVGNLEVAADAATVAVGPLAGAAVLGTLGKNLDANPAGPVVTQTPDAYSFDPIASLRTAHSSEQYIGSREPFEKTYDAYEKSQPREAPNTPHPNPRPEDRPFTNDRAPGHDDVQRRLDELRARGTRLPDVRRLESFRDSPQSGSFVHLSPEWVAQHCGQGRYQLCNVEGDLRGVIPPEGAVVDRGRNGKLSPQPSMTPHPQDHSRAPSPNSLSR